MDSDYTYEKYLNNMVPKTIDFATNMSSYYKFLLNTSTFIDRLDTFSVLGDDMHASHMPVINRLISTNIKQYKLKYQERFEKMKVIKDIPYNTNYKPSNILHLLSGGVEKHRIAEILSAYQLPKDVHITDNEYMVHFNNVDNCRLFNVIISVINLNLYVDTSIDKVVEDYKFKLKEKYENPKYVPKDKECNSYQIGKKYNSAEEMQADSGSQVFYDMQYDDTPYVMNSDYHNEHRAMPPAEYLNFLQEKLMNSLGFNEAKALQYATQITSGKRLIEEGVYAILDIHDDADGLLSRRYFVRRNNAWVEEVIDDEGVFANTSKTLCDMRTDCGIIDQSKGTSLDSNAGGNASCVSTRSTTIHKNNKMADEILTDFSTGLKINKEQLNNTLQTSYAHYFNTINKLYSLKRVSDMKYNRAQKSLGLLAENIEPIVSPYADLFLKILSHEDFTKRQDDILRFVSIFCRPPSPDDDIYWRYCKVTNVKLVPSFFVKLAYANSIGNYMKTVQIICADQGTVSDDGDAWIDKHSGFMIRKIDFDTDSGYETSGFKSISSGILDKDASEDIVETTAHGAAPANTTPSDPVIKMIKNVLSTLTEFMGISLDLDNLVLIINERVNAAAPSAMKDPSQSSKFNQLVFFFALAFLVVNIQTAIPSVKTRKTFPGCQRSFTGYPLEDGGDVSTIKYVACVALKIKSSIAPWNILKKLTDVKLIDKIKTFIEKYVIVLPRIKTQIHTKRDYIKASQSNGSELIPEEHAIEKWSTFLPPLVKTHAINTVANIAPGFIQSLLGDIKANKRHIFSLDVLRGKLYRISILIQQECNDIVSNTTPLLVGANAQPFIDNACCNDGDYNAMRYFMDKAPKGKIASYLKTIDNLQAQYHKINTLCNAPFLYDNEDTRVTYPSARAFGYSEEVIYRAFIAYCKYSSGLKVPDDLKTVSMRCPENFPATETIMNKIRFLKNNGITYTETNLLELMSIVNLKNVIKNDTTTHVNIAHELEDVILAITDRDGDNGLNLFLQHFNELIAGGTGAGRFEKYITRATAEIKKDLMVLIRQNETPNTATNVGLFWDMFTEVIDTADPNKLLPKLLDLTMKIVSVYPNIILNNLNNTASIPKHWALSQRHNSDIHKIITSQTILTNCYNDEGIKLIAQAVIQKSDDYKALLGVYPKNDGLISQDNLVLGAQFLFMSALHLYYTSESSSISLVPHVQDMNVEQVVNMGDLDLDGAEELDIMDDSPTVNKFRSLMISTYITLITKELEHGLLDYRYVKEKTHKAKEDEKNDITGFLNSLSIEEREVENLFKNNKLEKWSVGLQKGIREYDKETYDRETGVIDAKHDKHDKYEDEAGYLNDIAEADAEAELAEDINGQGDDDDYADGDDGDM